MAHEIEQHDRVGLLREKAWHGLGTIWSEEKTPVEALEDLGLDWEVEQWKLVARKKRVFEDHSHSGIYENIPCTQVANVRTDIDKILGIVTPHYELIQNRQLAEFCEALAEQDDKITVESAGSIRNGAKVWFLLKGESFSVWDKDEVAPYICVSNGHDGLTSLRCTPTTIRVVCSNTLHMVVPDESRSKTTLKIDGYTARHIGDVKGKVEEAKQALQLYGRSLETNRQLIDSLAAKDVSSEGVGQFFLECYTRDFGAFAKTPTTKIEHNQRRRAMLACSAFITRFDKERDAAGATAWNALNAYTGWLQHDKRARFKDSVKAEDSRLGSALFGANADRGVMAMQLALSM